MYGLGGDSVLVEDLVELDSIVDVADEDDHLVELELVNQVHQLRDLVALFKADVVLAETVEGELALVLDEDLGRVAHELTAGQLDLGRERGCEHHHLLSVGRLLENLLDVAAHVFIILSNNSHVGSLCGLSAMDSK